MVDHSYHFTLDITIMSSNLSIKGDIWNFLYRIYITGTGTGTGTSELSLCPACHLSLDKQI